MIQSRKKLLFNFLALAAIIIAGACNTNNFSEPQPASAKNIYEFPEMFRGYWSDRDFDMVFTDANHITFIDISQQKVPLDSSSFISIGVDSNSKGPAKFRQVNKVNYDTLGLPADTMITYIIREPLIYKMGSDHLLQTGYKYKQLKDTIVIFKNERQGIDIGNNAFLRKVSDSLYVLNISNRILIRDNYFWQVALIEKTPNDEINYYIPSDKIGTLPCMFYRYTDNFFYDCKWLPADIKKLMKEGYFEKTNVLKRTKPVVE
jgi:hypothetical protein